MVRYLKNIYHLIVAWVSNIIFGFPGKKLTVIGVTGTDGKTTTTTLIYEILKKCGKDVSMISSVHAVIGDVSYDTGFHVTSPNAWEIQKYLKKAVDHGDTHFVLEVTSHGIDQYRIYGIPFAVGVITNITPEHLDFHKTLEHYIKTKMKLLQSARIAVVNRDDDMIYTKVKKILPKDKNIITYGMQHDADVTPKNTPFTTMLPGIFNAYNCLAALSAVKALGLPMDKAVHAIAGVKGIDGRMEVVHKKDITVVVDFAHTPNALEHVLSALKQTTQGRLIHVFGSAGERDKVKRPHMGKISSHYADISILTEEDCRKEDVEAIMDDIASGMKNKGNVHKEKDRKKAIALALKLSKKGDTIVLTGKGHEKSLCRGNTEYPWNDKEEVRKLLRV